MEQINDMHGQQEVSEAIREAVAAAADLVDAGLRPARFEALEEASGPGGRQNLDLLLDVNIPVSVEVGRTTMSLDRILDLVPGSVITLPKRAEEPVDLRVNGKLVARGEVVLCDDTYGIRITQIVGATGE